MVVLFPTERKFFVTAEMLKAFVAYYTALYNSDPDSKILHWSFKLYE